MHTGGVDGGNTMMRDPIIAEIRKNRQELAGRLNFGLGAIIADAQKRQRGRGKRVVSFSASERKEKP
jgi:hypothetical protein